MAYEPTEWHKGDVVTAAKLNKLEQGVGSGGSELVVTFGYDNGARTADKTHSEVIGAYNNGQRVRFIYDAGTSVYLGELSYINENTGHLHFTSVFMPNPTSNVPLVIGTMTLASNETVTWQEKSIS